MERKVLLICAGGMSTGILMRKMEKYAEEQGISLKIEAVGMSAYEDVYKNYDVILLGPQQSLFWFPVRFLPPESVQRILHSPVLRFPCKS